MPLLSLLAIAAIFSTAFAEADNEYKAWAREQNIPLWVRVQFHKSGLDSTYAYSFDLNPCYLRGDFNGDGQADVAQLVNERATGKRGVLILHFGTDDHFVAGAGHSVGNWGDDFKWLDAWTVYRKSPVGQGVGEGSPPKLIGDALYVEKLESASGIIYWDSHQYQWYQQGD